MINLNEILAEAKSKGYRYKKSEFGRNTEFKYLFNFQDAYYKIGLLDKAFSIINDSKQSEITYTGRTSPLFITTSIGKCLVLPINASKDIEEQKIVISAERND